MPVPPAVLKSIDAIRHAISKAGGKGNHPPDLSRTVQALFRNPAEIVENTETLRAVLALAPDIEAFRGKGSQHAQHAFSRNLYSLVYDILERLPPSECETDPSPQESEVSPASRDAFNSLEALADHVFQRVRGPAVRSRHAAQLRSLAWDALSHIAEVQRRQAHHDHALAVAENVRASVEERDAAIQFLTAWWTDDEPDKATMTLLKKLEKDPPNRDFLITVLQAQIDLGLNDEFGALMAAEDWDENNEND